MPAMVIMLHDDEEEEDGEANFRGEWHLVHRSWSASHGLKWVVCC